MGKGTVCLIADLGGTNVRFKLVGFTQGPDHTLKESYVIASERYPSQDYLSLEDAIEQFLSPRKPGDDEWPVVACMCVAGPVENQKALITNLDWVVDSRLIESKLKIQLCHIFNDFVGVGYGVLALGPTDTVSLNTHQPTSHGTIAVIGPGTGLGQAFLTSHPTFTSQGPSPTDVGSNAASAQEYTVFPTEGGHCSFAPRNIEEFELMQYVAREQNITHVSVERVSSGSGLPSLYKFLHGIPPEEALLEKYDYITPKYINETAFARSDPTSVRAVQLFISILASEAGNMCLKTLPMGGLYITGGLAHRFDWAFKRFHFVEKVASKGRMSDLLSQIPVKLVTHKDIGLLGCEHYARRLMKTNGFMAK